MEPEDHVCLCFGVSLRKIQNYLAREDPKVASLISECLGAGTGCGWCVPYLKDLHRQHQEPDGQEDHRPVQLPTIEGSAEDYRNGRARFKQTGTREANGEKDKDTET